MWFPQSQTEFGKSLWLSKLEKLRLNVKYTDFLHSGKLMLFVLTFCVFSRSLSHFMLFLPLTSAKFMPLNILFWPTHKSVFHDCVPFCHSRKFIPKISQSFRKSFCQRKFLPLCPKVFFFSIYLLLTYNYPYTEMSFMPYSVTNSIKIIKCGYTVIFIC